MLLIRHNGTTQRWPNNLLTPLTCISSILMNLSESACAPFSNPDPDFTVVGESTSKQQAMANIFQLKPDIVILDVRLEDGSGIDAAREFLTLCDQTRILFLSNSLEGQTLLAAVASGAHGYVLRDADTETLLQALRTIARGHFFLDSRVTHHTFAYLRKLANRTPDITRLPLSPQEQRLLPLIAQGKTNKEIAAELGLSDKTVKNYLANVYNKLHITRRSQAAAFLFQTFLLKRRFASWPSRLLSER